MRVPYPALLAIAAIGLTGCIVAQPSRPPPPAYQGSAYQGSGYQRPMPPPGYQRPPPGYGGELPLTDY